MIEYLSASIGPVVEGLEDFEKIYALEQGNYIPLRTLPGDYGMSAITRWELTPKQRQAITDGADIMLEVIHFGGPLAPVRVAVMKMENDPHLWRRWFCAQTNGPYFTKILKRTEDAEGVNGLDL